VKVNSTFEGFVSGSVSAYRTFFFSRAQEWQSYSPKIKKDKYRYLGQQIFGQLGTDEDEEDYEMQRAFNEEKRQEIAAGASGEEGDGERGEDNRAGGENGDKRGGGSSKDVT